MIKCLLQALRNLLIVLLYREGQGLACQRDGIGGAICLVIHLSQLGETTPVFTSAERYGLLQRRNGGRKVTARFKHVAQVEAILHRARIDRDGFFQLLDGALGVSGEGQGNGEVVEKGGVRGGQVDGFAIFGERVRFLVVGAKGSSENVVRERVVWICSDGFCAKWR